MNVSDFLTIGIVGVLLSAVFQGIKQYLPTSSVGNKVAVAVAALLVAGIYVWLRQTVYWETVVLVLGVASAVYANFFKSNA